MFALSPHGDHELLQVTRNIVAKAPELEDWEFHPTKPPREWDLVFGVVVNGKDVEIDAKLWEFVVYKFKDGSYDLVLKQTMAQTSPTRLSIRQGLSSFYVATNSRRKAN